MPPADPARKLATYDEVLALPDGVTGEILDGMLIASPRPAYRHARTTTRLVGAIEPRYDRPSGGDHGPGGWIILFEPELHLGRHVVVPDIAGWRRERLPAVPDVPWLDLAPDWVCETVSPSSARTDRVQKMRIYREAGVAWMWLADPATRTIEVFQRDGDRWVLADTAVGDEPARLPPFEAVELELAWVWEGAGDVK